MNVERDADHSRVPRRQRSTLTLLERLTIVQASVFVIAATWAFGGQAEWVKGPLAAWGTLGAFIAMAAMLRPSPGASYLHVVVTLAPLVAFNAIVLVATTNPALREIHFGLETSLAIVGGRPDRPSSALPEAARTALWHLDAIWVSCYNIYLVVRHRRALRLLTLIAIMNALALAVFGTAQKLLGATGIFFGAVPSPQKYFFASFVYHNHWGSFIVLMMGGCVGLTWHFFRRRESRDFFHSPASGGLVTLLLLAATVPLSASRSCTVISAFILAGAFLHFALYLARARRRYNESVVLPIAAAAVAAGVAIAAIVYLGRDTIAVRTALTREQLQQARSAAVKNSRIQLYEDTVHMGDQKPWFGWGMASYPHVFVFYNTRQSVDGLPVYYHDAHSDWLQAYAEHGLIGTALLGASAIIPLVMSRRKIFNNSLSTYLLAGCAVVVLYSWVEFPFGNFAVVLSWWFCFWIAIQYSRLTATRPLNSEDVRTVA